MSFKTIFFVIHLCRIHINYFREATSKIVDSAMK